MVTYQDWASHMWVKWPTPDGRIARIKATHIVSMVQDTVHPSRTIVRTMDGATLLIDRIVEVCEQDLDLTPYMP